MKVEFVFFAVFCFIVGNFAWRYIKSGSITAALLDGTIKREIGQISLPSGKISSQNLKVTTLESNEGESFVCLCLVSKAPLSASMVPVKLSKNQVQELIQLLQQAVSHK